MSGHNRTTKSLDDNEDDDPVERMLRKAGCLEQHYSIQVILSFYFCFKETSVEYVL